MKFIVLEYFVADKLTVDEIFVYCTQFITLSVHFRCRN